MSGESKKRTDLQVVSYKPLGELQTITLDIATVRAALCSPTRSGKKPSDADVVQFMQLCLARQLNPWEGDAFLVGYDGKQGPEFSLITSLQALLKRAEVSREYRGLESGLVVEVDGKLLDIEGDILPDGAKLVGGWCKVHRDDRSIPTYKRIALAAYQKGTSFWSRDPGGMISKCARASALREAFPSLVGGLYIRDEWQEKGDVIQSTVVSSAVRTAADLNAELNDTLATTDADDNEVVDDTPQEEFSVEPDDVDQDSSAADEPDSQLDAIEQFASDLELALANAKTAQEVTAVQKDMLPQAMNDSGLLAVLNSSCAKRKRELRG